MLAHIHHASTTMVEQFQINNF